MRLARQSVLLAATACMAACAHRPPAREPVVAAGVSLAAEFSIPADTSGDPLKFGGLSGITVLPDGDLLAISDDRDNSRMYRLRIEHNERFRVNTAGSVLLRPGPGAPAAIDPEGIALTESGTVLISSEGVLETEPRVAPSISEYTLEGRFLRQLPVPARFVPDTHGALRQGVRPNAGFESLAVTPDYRYLFTGNEVPLVQDGSDEQVATGAGGRIRIVRYARAAGGYAPEREFAYELSAFGELTFEPTFIVNGLVELLALSGTELLALERGFAQGSDPQQALNRIRIFRVSLAQATDVSRVDSIRQPGTWRPAAKQLVVDLNALPGLSPSLRNLDNFEALAWIRDAGGSRQLLVVSDDNFNPRQVTAFLLLGTTGRWH